jgi:hypothetical protein
MDRDWSRIILLYGSKKGKGISRLEAANIKDIITPTLRRRSNSLRMRNHLRSRLSLLKIKRREGKSFLCNNFFEIK